MGINPKTVAYSAGMEVAKLVEKRDRKSVV